MDQLNRWSSRVAEDIFYNLLKNELKWQNVISLVINEEIINYY